MTTFWIVAGLLTVGALLFIIPPLLGWKRQRTNTTPAELNLSIYRDQLRELDDELAAGALDETQYRSARSELEGRVIEDSGVPEGTAAVSTSHWPAVVMVLVLPITAVLLYLWLGNTHWMEARNNPAKTEQAHALTPEKIQAMVAGLEQRLEQQPNDANGWIMLARSYGVLQRYRESSVAYARAVELQPNDAALLADYADNLAMANGRVLQGEPEQIIQRALQADPNNIKALALAGSVHFERKDYQGAINEWQKILDLQPADSQMTNSVGASVDEARKLAGLGSAKGKQAAGKTAADGAGGAAVSGRVQLDPALKARVADSDTVFIFARAVSGKRGPPLAILRKTVKDLPFSFTLDDSMAMAPAFNLSSVSQVVVGARISRSGNANPSQGDLEGYSQPEKIGAKGVNVTIGSTVK